MCQIAILEWLDTRPQLYQAICKIITVLFFWLSKL